MLKSILRTLLKIERKNTEFVLFYEFRFFLKHNKKWVSRVEVVDDRRNHGERLGLCRTERMLKTGYSHGRQWKKTQ